MGGLAAKRWHAVSTPPHQGRRDDDEKLPEALPGGWNFRWGLFDTPRTLDVACAAKRAGVFLRWCKWIRTHRIPKSDAVFVNMDETRLSTIREWSNGLASAAGPADGSLWTTRRARTPPAPRTTNFFSKFAELETVLANYQP